MSSERAPLAQLAEAFEGASEVDDIASATLRAVAGLDGVIRAGLALSVVGGRQLRFLSSDPEHLGPPAQWCLIDAYDSLPLNDAVRTGRDVVLETPARFARAYPELAAEQQDAGVRSVVALILTAARQRFGGLLVYRDREVSGTDRDAVRTLKAVAAQVTEALTAAHAAAADPSERDWTSAMASTASGEVVGSAHAPLPADATAPASARDFVRHTLDGWRVPRGVVDAAVLCASELVTNVVVHVRRASVITVERHDGSLTVAVHQPRGPAKRSIKPLDRPDLLAVAGRGLTLVHALSSRWGSEPTPDGTRVWFQIDVAG